MCFYKTQNFLLKDSFSDVKKHAKKDGGIRFEGEMLKLGVTVIFLLNF